MDPTEAKERRDRNRAAGARARARTDESGARGEGDVTDVRCAYTSPELRGPLTLRGTAALVTSTLLGGLAAGALAWVLHWVLAQGDGFGVLWALCAALAMFAVVPIGAGGVGGWIVARGAVLGHCANATAIRLAAGAAAAGGTAVFALLRIRHLGPEAFDSGLDVAKVVALLVLGIGAAISVSIDQVGEHPVCDDCFRYFKRRRSARFGRDVLPALVDEVRGTHLEAVRARLGSKDRPSTGEEWVQIELAWCDACRAKAFADVLLCRSVTEGRGRNQKTVTHRRRVVSRLIDGGRLARILGDEVVGGGGSR